LKPFCALFPIPAFFAAKHSGLFAEIPLRNLKTRQFFYRYCPQFFKFTTESIFPINIDQMKNTYFLYLLLLCFGARVSAQSVLMPRTDTKEYELMKKEGRIPAGPVTAPAGSFTPSLADLEKLGGVHKMPSTGCSCYIPPDGTYSVAMAPNDDGSTGLLAIPFTFCLYGTNHTNLYINNNGNISFGSPYSTFSSFPFPDPSFIMVAPFWGDVDTRGTGTVYYKITPTAMYVNWEAVGYYSSYTDKVNTFQLIITDGTDPILPAGNNIAFCYGDMQWTTGDASGGGGTGFGGVPSTVGVNKGDGINYIQIGRFDAPGAAYDGGYGANDGVSWLDNQSFYFNSCSSTNIAPIASGISNCDTIHVCGSGDTLLLDGLFLSPEIGQNTTITVDLHGTPGTTIVSNVPGNSAEAIVQLIASAANAGNNVITFTAVDNGTPTGTTVVNVNVFVDTTGLLGFNPLITGLTEFCEGSTSTLTVTPGTFDTYLWNTGSTTNSTIVDSSGLYFCTSTLLGCTKTNQVQVTVHPKPTPLITGAANICAGASTVLSVDSLMYTAYSWSPGGSTNDSVTVPVGTYFVTVTDTNGCTGTSPAFTVFSSPLPAITGPSAVCNGDLAPLTTTGPYLTYSWSPGGSTNDSIFAGAGTYTVTVLDTAGCLITSPPFSVSVFNYSLAVTGVVPYCAGQFITLTAAGTPSSGASYLWSTGSSSSSINVAAGGNITVTLTYPALGCTTDTTFTVPGPNPLPTPLITGSNLTCNSTATTLGIDSTSLYTSYVWSNSSTSSTISTLNGTFTVTVTDANNCTGTSPAFTVTNFDPSITITGANDFCPGGSDVLNANTSIPSGATFLWSNSATTQSQTITVAGTYYVTVSYPNGCSDGDTVSITQYPSPLANFTVSPTTFSPPGTTVSFTDASSISSGTIVSWVWDFGDSLGIGSTSGLQNPTHVYGADGIYMVTLAVQSNNGCWDTVHIDYIVASEVQAPNVFTPNGDNINDELVFQNLEYFPGTSLTVYNRWGNKIYSSPDYKNDWDGAGHSDGVYYYILEGPKLKETKYGFVQLIR
jgi:gliding motility-associated-like protein